MLWTKETFQLRLMLFVLILFIAATVQSCQEIRYTVFGKEAVATITDSKTVTRYRRRDELRLRYAFVDVDGTNRLEADEVSLHFVPSLQDASGRPAVAIQFIPGTIDASRIPSGSRWYMIGLFCVSLVALVVVSVRFWKNYQEHERRKARSFGS